MDVLSYMLGKKSEEGAAEIDSDTYIFVDENDDGNIDVQEVE